eukprot:93462_1
MNQMKIQICQHFIQFHHVSYQKYPLLQIFKHIILFLQFYYHQQLQVSIKLPINHTEYLYQQTHIESSATTQRYVSHTKLMNDNYNVPQTETLQTINNSPTLIGYSYSNIIDNAEANNLTNIDYISWTCDEVCKYFSEQLSSLADTELLHLKTNITSEGIDGSLLNIITRDDLHRFGVIKMRDKLLLENNIQI